MEFETMEVNPRKKAEKIADDIDKDKLWEMFSKLNHENKINIIESINSSLLLEEEEKREKRLFENLIKAMNEIESKLDLPPAARTLIKWSRYTNHENGFVGKFIYSLLDPERLTTEYLLKYISYDKDGNPIGDGLYSLAEKLELDEDDRESLFAFRQMEINGLA